jgi:preprotein translocase subunit SecG
MFTIFLVLITIVCFLLVVVIMVQNPKGGGLSSTLGGSTQMGGVQKTTDFLDKSTWTLATFLIALILFSSISFYTGDKAPEPTTEDSAPAKTETPAASKPASDAKPVSTPAETPVNVPVKK